MSASPVRASRASGSADQLDFESCRGARSRHRRHARGKRPAMQGPNIGCLRGGSAALTAPLWLGARKALCHRPIPFLAVPQAPTLETSFPRARSHLTICAPGRPYRPHTSSGHGPASSATPRSFNLRDMTLQTDVTLAATPPTAEKHASIPNQLERFVDTFPRGAAGRGGPPGPRWGGIVSQLEPLPARLARACIQSPDTGAVVPAQRSIRAGCAGTGLGTILRHHP